LCAQTALLLLLLQAYVRAQNASTRCSPVAAQTLHVNCAAAAAALQTNLEPQWMAQRLTSHLLDWLDMYVHEQGGSPAA
jgi:hypothetical protein